MPPFVVLDVNVLRKQTVMEACIARFEQDGGQIAFPEMALFELTRHPQRWESTIRRSLELLARRPAAVVLARSSKPLGLAEEATGIPTRTVVDVPLSEAFRRVLRDIRGGVGPDLDHVLHAIAQYRGALDHEEHAADSLQTMQALKKLGRPSLPHEVAVRISADLSKGSRASFREFLAGTLRINEQRNAHVRRGVPDRNADALLLAPSVSYLYALAVGALALEWAFNGGVESAAPGRVANDILDIEYIIAGFWVGRLVSADAGARARFDDLKAVGVSAWPFHADWFRRAEAVSPDVAVVPLSPA